MSYLLPLVVSCLVFVALGDSGDNTSDVTTKKTPQQTQNFFEDIGDGVKKEVATIKQPVEEAAVYIGSSQCSKVKKLLGVAYEQVEGEKEPDLNQLSLEFITNDFSVTYKLNRAAEMIPQSRGYNPDQKLYIYIHGFTDNPGEASFSNISNALFSQGQCNVLALDASTLIRWFYLRSATYVRFIGQKLGEVLAAMTQSGVDPEEIHIIGHSLGSHIASFTGKQFTNMTGLGVGRISGLDPAGPCFSHIDDDLRLKSTDANFVDVIHTDAGVLGLKTPVGDVDYYPNEGKEQPDCFSQSCSHSRAWLYYTESVMNSKAFPALKCASWDAFKIGNCSQNVEDISYMGHPSQPGTTGLYYLQTNGESPFGRGEAGLKYESNDGFLKKIANGPAGTYTGNDYVVIRDGGDRAEKIGKRFRKVIKKIIETAKYIFSQEDCDSSLKDDILDKWEQKNNEILENEKKLQDSEKGDSPESDNLPESEKDNTLENENTPVEYDKDILAEMDTKPVENDNKPENEEIRPFENENNPSGENENNVSESKNMNPESEQDMKKLTNKKLKNKKFKKNKMIKSKIPDDILIQNATQFYI